MASRSAVVALASSVVRRAMMNNSSSASLTQARRFAAGMYMYSFMVFSYTCFALLLFMFFFVEFWFSYQKTNSPHSTFYFVSFFFPQGDTGQDRRTRDSRCTNRRSSTRRSDSLPGRPCGFGSFTASTTTETRSSTDTTHTGCMTLSKRRRKS